MQIDQLVNELQRQLQEETTRSENIYEIARIYRDGILPAMTALREKVDAVEPLLPNECLSYPTYDKLLFGIAQ